MPLRAHFLHVGIGDCTIVEFPLEGRVGLIDIDDSDSEDTTDPIDFIDRTVGSQRSIFRVIVTHPDMDHMTGLRRLNDSKSIVNFWHTGPNDFNLADTSDDEWDASRYSKYDWLTYKDLRGSTDDNPTSLHQRQGNSRDFWKQDQIEIWSPTASLEELARKKDMPNIQSMVLKITYKGRTIVLGGDATADETWPEILNSVDVGKIDVLKASHHGRDSGFYEPAAKKMSPFLAITGVTRPMTPLRTTASTPIMPSRCMTQEI
jgi:beta-lactamase superfamily II metal-dependent hydrolase